jgi:uncharacterized protein YecE (DUF72 family)
MLLALLLPMARIRVGTSGWSYPSWRGTFYPQDWPRTRELELASRTFASLEINRSFYSLLTPACCQAWYAGTPRDFVFALKGSQFITHHKKLRNVETALANFFASGPLALAEKLGPIVWQLPAKQVFDESRLADFLAQLPRTLQAAAALAARHDDRLRHGAYLEVRRNRRIRHVLEARHDSFFTPALVELLARHDVALAVSDSPTWNYVEEPTASFMYLRLHGSEQLYTSSYSDAELAHWLERIVAWHTGREPESARRIAGARSRAQRARDVYVYFDNDVGGRAVANARSLLGLLDRSDSPKARRGAAPQRAAATVTNLLHDHRAPRKRRKSA